MAKFFSHFDWFIDWWTSRWSSILTCKKHFWLSFHQQHRHGEKMQGVNYHFHKATTQKANCTQWQSWLGVHFTFLFSLYIISRWVNILIECCSQSCISPSDRTDQSSQILVGEPRQKRLWKLRLLWLKNAQDEVRKLKGSLGGFYESWPRNP